MLLKHIYDPRLAQASYLIGCQATGEAVVVDPNRDAEQYIRLAEDEGLRITHVTETHIHADFLSGARELAERTGALLLLSDEGGDDWRYEFAESAGARLLKDGDEFMVGNLKFEVLHTPGHTPEHISFLVTDTPATDAPMGILTGDFVFVGDVGRPDLLEKAAKIAGTMEAGARTLFRSLQKFKKLPDHLQIWPGHGAGSACGKALGAVPQSTLGYERITNWGLAESDEDRFVSAVLAGQPEPPKYFAEMKRLNKIGPRVLHGFRRPERLGVDQLARALDGGVVVVDTRPADRFAAAHVPGTLNIPLNRSFNTWAGWLIPYDTDFHVITDGSGTEAIDHIVRDLAMIGLDQLAGYYDGDVVQQWIASGRETDTVGHVTAAEVERRHAAGDATIIDVRGQAEWDAGHIPQVQNIPVGHLPERLDEIPRDKPVLVHCQSGGRSAIAASVLEAAGFRNVSNFHGGFEEWRRSGRPVERGADAGAMAGV